MRVRLLAQARLWKPDLYARHKHTTYRYKKHMYVQIALNLKQWQTCVRRLEIFPTLSRFSDCAPQLDWFESEEDKLP